MKKFAITFLALFIVFIGFSQQKEERQTSQFNSISVGVPADVIITKGSQHKVVLEGNIEDLEKIETDVSGDQLSIRNKDDDWWGDNDLDEVTIYISMPSLQGVALAGSGSVTSNDSFETSDFEVDISGSGKIRLNINSDDTDIQISGSGKIILKGSSESLDISISGSGDVEAKELHVANADIRIMGSGNCTVNVSEDLESTIMGSGDVYYVGEPKHLNNNSMGSGKLKKI